MGISLRSNVLTMGLHEDCGKHPVFGSPDDDQALYDRTHEHPADVDLKHRRCLHEGCDKHPMMAKLYTARLTSGLTMWIW
jgi:hypothetical protein